MYMIYSSKVEMQNSGQKRRAQSSGSMTEVETADYKNTNKTIVSITSARTNDLKWKRDREEHTASQQEA